MTFHASQTLMSINTSNVKNKYKQKIKSERMIEMYVYMLYYELCSPYIDIIDDKNSFSGKLLKIFLLIFFG